MKHRLHSYACVLTAAVALQGSLVRAADDANAEDRRRAGELFRAAQAAHGAGDHPAAARAFEQAHELVPSGSALYNAARSWESAGRPAEAADDYALGLLQVDLAGGNRDHADKRLAALRRGLFTAEIRGAPELRAGRAAGAERTLPVVLHFPPGSQELFVVHGDGRAERRTVQGAAGAMLTIDLAGAAPDASPSAASAPRAQPPNAPAATASLPTGPRPPSRVLAWTGVAIAVGASTAAVLFGLRTMAQREALIDSEFTSQRAHDNALQARLLANVSWAVAVAGAGVAVYGFLRTGAANRSPREHVRLMIAPGLVALAGAF